MGVDASTGSREEVRRVTPRSACASPESGQVGQPSVQSAVRDASGPRSPAFPARRLCALRTQRPLGTELSLPNRRFWQLSPVVGGLHGPPYCAHSRTRSGSLWDARARYQPLEAPAPAPRDPVASGIVPRAPRATLAGATRNRRWCAETTRSRYWRPRQRHDSRLMNSRAIGASDVARFARTGSAIQRHRLDCWSAAFPSHRLTALGARSRNSDRTVRSVLPGPTRRVGRAHGAYASAYAAAQAPCSFSRLCDSPISAHSPRTLSRPRTGIGGSHDFSPARKRARR